jgi:hypothetical protein
MLGDASGKVSALGGVFALVLLVSLFLPWAQVVCVQEPCRYPTGWEVLRFLDVVLVCLAVASFAVAALSVMRPATGPAVALIALGAVALFLVFLAPGVEDRGPQPVDFGGSWFLGVLGALGVAAAGVATYFLRAETGGDEDEDEEGAGDEGEGDAAGQEDEDEEDEAAAAGDHEQGNGDDEAGEDEGAGGKDKGASSDESAEDAEEDRDARGDEVAENGGEGDSRT